MEKKRLSRYFLPCQREAPRDAEIVSHKLMLRAGLIRQETAGIYSWLPFGMSILQKICTVVREEQNRTGALEILMPTLQSADLWRTSGRYESYGKEMLRLRDRNDRELIYGPTNEEMVTSLFASYVKSWRDLPLNLYHIQWKFRDEIRPRFGVMRGREFLMKDAYTFALDEAGATHMYNQMFIAYLKTFARLGLKAIPMRAETGPIGGDKSHEFVVLAQTGESKVYCDGTLFDLEVPDDGIDFDKDLGPEVAKWTTPYAATDDQHDPERFAAQVPPDRRRESRGIEAGHIFYFGTLYSETLKALVLDDQGASRAVHMGSYGIGPSRLVATLIEVFHDDRGIVWPRIVAPFEIILLNVSPDDEACCAACDELYDRLGQSYDILYDDRRDRPGEKFARADLVGIPLQIVVGRRGVQNGEIDVALRTDASRRAIPLEGLDLWLKDNFAPRA